MKIPGDPLPASALQPLLGTYLISGDEPLLIGEAADAVRAAARREGADERTVHHIERGLGWDAVRAAASSLSLFASRRLIEIRIATGKPGPEGARVLTGLIEARDPTLTILIVTGRLEREAQSSAWMRAADTHGAVVTIGPVGSERLSAWLAARARKRGLDLEPGAARLLAERTEGNLLAADQELEKLGLLTAPGSRVTVQTVLGDTADNARFSIYQLSQALGAGDGARALRVLSGLRAEDAELPLVLWAVVRALRAASRAPHPGVIERAGRADRMAKGQMAGNAWDELALLAADFCGRPALSIPRVLK